MGQIISPLFSFHIIMINQFERLVILLQKIIKSWHFLNTTFFSMIDVTFTLQLETNDLWWWWNNKSQQQSIRQFKIVIKLKLFLFVQCFSPSLNVEDLTVMGSPMCQIYLLHIGRTWIIDFAFLLNNCPPYPIWDVQFVFVHIIRNVNYHVVVVNIGINNWWMLGMWKMVKSKLQCIRGFIWQCNV